MLAAADANRFDWHASFLQGRFHDLGLLERHCPIGISVHS
jgi:hypothetical protein